eukprot:388607_1
MSSLGQSFTELKQPPNFETRQGIIGNVINNWSRNAKKGDLIKDIKSVIIDYYPLKFYGDNRGYTQVFDLTEGPKVLHIRAGAAIDCVYTSTDDWIGGKGGNYGSLDVNKDKILSIGGTIGEWGGKVFVTSLIFRTTKSFKSFGGGWTKLYTFMINAKSEKIGLTKLILTARGRGDQNHAEYIVNGVWAE